MEKKLFKPDTIVRLKKTGEFARILRIGYLMDGQTFLHYYIEIEGRAPGTIWAGYHDDMEFECPPREDADAGRQ